MLTAEIVEGLVKTVLARNFDEPKPTPECHKEWWKLACSKAARVAIAAPRGFAKSTAITHSYLLACLLFRERDFALIVSDTEGQAIMFLADLKAEIMNNENLIELFRPKRDHEGNVILFKDAETDVIVEFEDGHQFRIVARGANQRVRGLKWVHKRPDIIICDDLENDEIVLNKDRRAKFMRWFYGALLPCMSDNGIIRVVGTILHMDSLLENLMPNRQLSGMRQSKKLLVSPLKEWTDVRTAWVSVRYRAHSDDFQHLLWGEKRGVEELKAKRADYISRGIPEVYAQEYLNVPLDDSFTYFKRGDFLAMTQDQKLDPNCKYYATVDFAISEEQRADYTVMLIAAVDAGGLIHIRRVVRERMDGGEMVDLILRLQHHYKFEWLGVEEGVIKKSIWSFLRERMHEVQIFPNFMMLKPTRDKETRARAIQGRMRAQTIRFDKDSDWYQDFEDELTRFPRDKHDDQVDAFAWLGLMLDKLIHGITPREAELESLEEERRHFEFVDGTQGQNPTTGY
jgi:predicted phage terminase large subunit-like protein